MQSKIITDKELVKSCIEELCQKAVLADTESMAQRDFEFLCNSIESKTGILISLSTIKRLFNGQFSRLPQVATLDAICSFIGYKNWQDFKINKKQSLFQKESGKNESKNNIVENNGSYGTKRVNYFIAGGLLFLIAVILIAWLKLKKPGVSNLNKVQFSANKITYNDIPNTVVFNYNVDDINADSFFIQQSWDRNRREKINKNQHTFTDIYYEPGYHVAKLIANDQIIKTVDVSIPTDKWFFYAKEQVPGSLPKYISSSGYKNGKLTITKDEVISSLINIEKENQYLVVYFPSAFKANSDNFILKCRAKVNEIRNSVCPSLMCEIFCQKNFMYFKTKPKGCSNEINVQFGDSIFNGRTKNLSSLAADVKNWQDIELTVRNKKVSIKINNTEVFTTQYNESSLLITGLGFISNGLPEVDFVSLKTLTGKDIYSDDFEIK